MLACTGRVDFEQALAENERLLLLFLRNSYMDAIDQISAKSKTHFTYAQGHANFTILKAIVTLDPEEIETALGTCQEALDSCNESRRKVSWIASWFWKTDTNDYTDGESFYIFNLLIVNRNRFHLQRKYTRSWATPKRPYLWPC